MSAPREPVRLSKQVAAMVPCSRSEAEQYIIGGWVRVNGKVVEEPQARVTDERIELDPAASLDALEPVTLLLHKPAGLGEAGARRLLLPANHWPDDPAGIRTVKKHFVHLDGLMELPAPASGLAVFTQDHRIVRKLEEDARLIEQELLAEVAGEIAPNGLARLCHGLVYDHQPLPPARVSWQSEHRLRFAVKGIPPWLLPWMVEQVGLRLVALRRLRIGRVPMAQLAPGQWRYLQPGEKF